MVPNVAVWKPGVGIVRRGPLISSSISLSRDSTNGSGLDTESQSLVPKRSLHSVNI